MSTLAVVEAVLRNAAVPLSVREIVERAGDTLPTKSKTPDTVVARDLSMDIKKRGEGSLFMRTSPGRYAIRELALRQQPVDETAAAAVYPPLSVPTGNGTVASDSPPTPIGQTIGGERAGTRPATKPPTNKTEEMSA